MRVNRQLVDDILRRVVVPIKAAGILKKYNTQRGADVPIVNKRDLNSFLYSNKVDYIHDAVSFEWQKRAVADNAEERPAAAPLVNVAVVAEAQAAPAAPEAPTRAHLDAVGANGSAADPALETQCVVCMDERRSVLFTPCKHICVCSACALQLRTPVCCPMCRAVVATQVTGVFF
jgi:hypothetical protein